MKELRQSLLKLFADMESELETYVEETDQDSLTFEDFWNSYFRRHQNFAECIGVDSVVPSANDINDAKLEDPLHIIDDVDGFSTKSEK